MKDLKEVCTVHYELRIPSTTQNVIHATFWPKFACAGKEMGVTDFINSKASGRPVHEVLRLVAWQQTKYQRGRTDVRTCRWSGRWRVGVSTTASSAPGSITCCVRPSCPLMMYVVLAYTKLSLPLSLPGTFGPIRPSTVSYLSDKRTWY